MERVEDLMAKRQWMKHCLRTNCAAPEECVMTGKIKAAKIYSNLLWQLEKELELYDAIQAISPERWGEDTRIIQPIFNCKQTQGRKQSTFVVLMA